MTKITEQELSSILWKDISIQEMPNKEKVLILICETEKQSDRLMLLLQGNTFHLKLLIDKDKCYIIQLYFINSDYAIGNDTKLSIETYPALEWLAKSEVKFITTGIWIDKGVAGYRKDAKELSRVYLN